MRLITLRLEKNITQKELADTLEIDKSLISQYESEISKPSYATVQRIADFFGVTVDYLTNNPVTEVISYQETKDLFRDTTRDKVTPEKGLRPEYLAIAEEIQGAGIEIEDVRAFIAMIIKYKG
jgi:transcriptional regulator with XRE-family HTH domain